MNRRDFIFISVIVVLTLWCVQMHQRVNDLTEQNDSWKANRFEMTHELISLQRRLFLMSEKSGQPSSRLLLEPDEIYKLNLLERDQFEPAFLKYAGKLKLMALSMQMTTPLVGEGGLKRENGSDENFPDIWPTQGTITSLFGLRKHPIYKTLRFHSGVDIANLKDTEVLAAASGTVKYAGREGGYGNVVIVDHGNGFESRYGHAEEVLVHAGDTVKKGQLIASMGSTGVSTGNHLHYEIRFGGEVLDPTAFVK